MQKQAEWIKLNNIPETSTYIEFPLAFTGKTKSGKPSAFEGLFLSAQFVLAVIHTMNKIYKEPAKLTYDYFVNNFGMSRETVSRALAMLTRLKIIESTKQSRYKIIVSYSKRDYVEIDTYWLKYEWMLEGKTKRLTYSRLITLALLKRGNTNPETNGEFISSQARIGKAINLPTSTAGDSVRELKAVGAINYEKKDSNDNRKRGCSLFTVNPQILEVKHPRLNIEGFKALFAKREHTADELHKRFMLDTEYKDIFGRIFENKNAIISETLKTYGKGSQKLEELEAEALHLKEELSIYYSNHKIKLEKLPKEYFEYFPAGFFKEITTQNEAI